MIIGVIQQLVASITLTDLRTGLLAENENNNNYLHNRRNKVNTYTYKQTDIHTYLQ